MIPKLTKRHTLEELYVSPVIQEPDGSFRVLSMEEMTSERLPKTGIEVLDAIIEGLASTNVKHPATFAKAMDVPVVPLSSTVFVLTGMTFRELIHQYRLRQIEDLIEKTQLTPDEIAQRTGFSGGDTIAHFLQRRKNSSFHALRGRSQAVSMEKVIRYKLK